MTPTHPPTHPPTYSHPHPHTHERKLQDDTHAYPPLPPRPPTYLPGRELTSGDDIGGDVVAKVDCPLCPAPQHLLRVCVCVCVCVCVMYVSVLCVGVCMCVCACLAFVTDQDMRTHTHIDYLHQHKTHMRTSGMRKCQKRPIHMAKETYLYGKRGLLLLAYFSAASTLRLGSVVLPQVC